VLKIVEIIWKEEQFVTLENVHLCEVFVHSSRYSDETSKLQLAEYVVRVVIQRNRHRILV
jgi:hypothetical protein